jgi:hypothetical protein
MRMSEQEPPFESRIERNLDPSEFDELVRQFLKRPMEDFDRDARYVAKHRGDLTAEYPDEWVAIIECKVVAHSADIQDLTLRLDEMDLRQQSVVRFLWSTPVNLIL